MADRAHHSIGEVLSLLKEDYADVTISKIRFLESQGLIDPERTPSGYRKFYDTDIERLRWILTQQRDNFLPLKVIKRRLEDAGFELSEASTAPDGPLPEPTLFTRRDDDTTIAADTATAETSDADDGDGETDDSTSTADDAPPEADDSSSAETSPDGEPTPPAPPEPPAEPAPSSTAPVTARIADGEPLATPSGSVSLSAGELAGAAGVDLAFVDELEKLGLIDTVGPDGGAASFDHEALVVAKAAAEFVERGLELRHLRMFKVAAEREAGLFEQLTAPGIRKGGESRSRAKAELNELARLGETIHRSVLRRALGSSLD